jgi:hypothetical protein
MDGLLRALIKTVRRRLRADEVTVEAVTKDRLYAAIHFRPSTAPDVSSASS